MEKSDEWGVFELRVAALMSTMADGGQFSLHVPCEDGTTDEFVVSATDRCATVTIESSAWGSTELQFDIDGPADLAGAGSAVGEVLVEIIRDEYGLVHPALMTSSAPVALRDRIGALGLTAREAVGADHVLTDPVTNEQVRWPSTHDELYATVQAHLRDTFDTDIEPDEDGDLPIEVNGVRLWVKVAEDQPAILLLTVAVPRVRSRQQADTELNIANRDSWWVRWSRRGRMVLQELALPARPFVPSQFDGMVQVFVDAHAQTRTDMMERLYAQEAR
ncbi:T3SS (YopN, CesT) and YbjN peptide-binding chaperone 1 [Propionibacteriaceae bacterium Y2011]